MPTKIEFVKLILSPIKRIVHQSKSLIWVGEYTNLMFCQCSMEVNEGGGLRGGVNILVVIVDGEQETEPELN